MSARREIEMEKASGIPPRPVQWLWQDRIPLGALTLLAGREGLGKSTVAYTLGARGTRGKLPGLYYDKPKAVIVVATEDSWQHTIVPRLMAAGADLDLVYRVKSVIVNGKHISLSLPEDIEVLEQRVHEVDAGLILLDPLVSRLTARIDTHKDHSVRQALDPIGELADRTACAVLGLIHVNKGKSNDPMQAINGSAAFGAVARATLFVVKDPDNESVRLLGQTKNNLGILDPTLWSFTLESTCVMDTDEGPVIAPRIVWGDEIDRTVEDVLEAAHDESDVRTAVADAADWLADYLAHAPGREALASTIKTEAAQAGHTKSTLQRARNRLRIKVSPTNPPTFPRNTMWALPTALITKTTRTTTTTRTIGTTRTTVVPVVPVVPVVRNEKTGTTVRARAARAPRRKS